MSEPALTYEQMIDDICNRMHGSSDRLTQTLAGMISATRENHSSWCENCTADHFDNSFPCEEFERAFAIALAWLTSRGER